MLREADLFQVGSFRLHSGEWSGFRIECEALSGGEVYVLCFELARRLPSYRAAEGVPTGGLVLAKMMARWASGRDCDPLLIVDDVYTTGTSMEAHRAGRTCLGAVLFARRPVTHSWITALLTMTAEPVEAEMHHAPTEC